MGLAQRTGARRTRTGPREASLREARVCYDHLAGERAVAMLASLRSRGLIEGEGELQLTGRGRAFFVELGIDTDRLSAGRRPLCRPCLDWSERRAHLSGALGAALLNHLLAQQWVSRTAGRGVVFTRPGLAALAAHFG